MADNPTAEPQGSANVEFGRFTVRPLRREVFADGKPIELGGRAFDVLLALIETAGSVLTKDDLMSRVWAGRIVEDNSLEAQISALRKALGPDRNLIRTVAGRGYQFIGKIRASASAQIAVHAHAPSTNLREFGSRLIGRDTEVGEIIEWAKQHRQITLVGAGGVGKTRLGFEVARQLLPQFADGVWVVELAPLSDPALVPAAVATALGITLTSSAPSPETVAAALGTKRVLLVLDNCEHVIDAAARMVEVLLRTTPLARVLATSREPLRAPGERLFWLAPLDVPAEGMEEPADLLATGAVKLFVARMRAVEPQYSPNRTATAVIATICRRLDGIPLAIELAAARAVYLGVDELALRLDDRFRLLTGGYRTALPRQQTLRATLDWSYDLLAESEQAVLRRLAIFAGAFELEAAAVVVESPTSGFDVVDGISNLMAKSLVTASVGTATTRYWLLETTRAYALEKLIESGERNALSRRHAEYFRDALMTASTEWEAQTRADWLAAHGHQLDNVRMALDWAFSSQGDAEIGVALVVAAVPLWLDLSLVAECSARAEQALESRTQAADRLTRLDMQLYGALAAALLYAKGHNEEGHNASTRALEIAEHLDDVSYRLQALWGLWAYRINVGEYRKALALAQEFASVATSKGEPADGLIGDRMVGRTFHYLGDHDSARRHLERMLGHYVAPSDRSDLVRYQADQRAMSQCTLANILWLQGFPDQAVDMARSAIDSAEAVDHTITLCNALGHAACPVALFNGDLDEAGRYVETLLALSANRMLAHLRGRCIEGVLLLRRGELESGLQRLSSALQEHRESGLAGLHFNAFFGELAQGLGNAGRVAEGLVVIDEALERSAINEERWCTAELLRIKGELVWSAGGAQAFASAEGHFQQGLDWARRQGALSWQLRCATGLARLWREHGHADRARELLASIYSEFTEGFETADLRSARTLLALLNDVASGSHS